MPYVILIQFSLARLNLEICRIVHRTEKDDYETDHVCKSQKTNLDIYNKMILFDGLECQ